MVKKKILPDKIGIGFKAKSLVLFVHGLGGENEMWFTLTKLLESESNFNISFDLKYYDYKTAILSSFFLKKIDIINISESLESKISETFRDYDQIILVSHSMGGLIAKLAVIETCLKKKVNRVDTLIFYDTPHLGSQKASLVKAFVRNVQIKGLVRHKNHVVKYIQKLWRYLELDKLKTRCLIAENEFVVDEESASNYYGNANVIRCGGTNHFNIYKPKLNTDSSFTTLYNVLKDINDNSEDVDPEIPDDDTDEQWYNVTVR